MLIKHLYTIMCSVENGIIKKVTKIEVEKKKTTAEQVTKT